jgi:catechol 2,3-dioxygenase-like lactoylglutathione lyase family enzyme
MERSLAFYRDLLGLEVVLDTEMRGEMLEREVGLDGAHLRLVTLGAGSSTPYVELLQYYAPAGAPIPPDARPSDVGADHVALLVADIEEAYEALNARGVRFTCPPQEVDAGFFRGHRTAYCFDPDDLIVELWQTASA